jgi:alkylation response protein AidB-like acyl-CoA dehydrogenase
MRSSTERAVMDKMAALNLLGVCIPEEYGAPGLITFHSGLFAKN